MKFSVVILDSLSFFHILLKNLSYFKNLKKELKFFIFDLSSFLDSYLKFSCLQDEPGQRETSGTRP